MANMASKDPGRDHSVMGGAIISESVAGFLLECAAGFVGIRRGRHPSVTGGRLRRNRHAE